MTGDCCEKCEFWNPPGTNQAPAGEFGECDGGIPGDDSRGTLAYIQSSDEWTSRLFTKAGFVCGMFVVRQ